MTESKHGKATGADQANQDTESEMEEQELEGFEILEALVRLDLEAGLAYDAAADLAGDEETAKQLRSFRDDHFRHVDDLNPFLEQEGAKPLDRNAAPPPLLPWLARLAGPLGESTMVLTLVNNEQLTNLTYEAALAYDWDEGVEEVLERNRGDEDRHLTWLSEQESRMEEQQDEAGEEEPEPPEAPGR